MSQQGPATTGAGIIPGNQVQFVETSTGAKVSTTAIIPRDGTIPQQTEGVQIFSLAITPTKATNRLILNAVINISLNDPSLTPGNSASAFFQDATANAIASFLLDTSPTGGVLDSKTHNMYYTMIAGTTSPTTFKVRVGVDLAPAILDINDTVLYGGLISTFIIAEVEV